MSVSPLLLLLGDTNAPTPLLRAMFTAADGTALGSYTPEVGAAPTVESGTWQVTGNRLQNTTGTLGRAVAALGVAGAVVGATFRNVTTAGLTWGLLPRWQDANNNWLVVYNGSGGLFIFEVTAGTGTQRASAALTVLADTDYLVVAAWQGNTLTVYVNGVATVSYASASAFAAATACAVRADAANVRIDNWLAYRAGAVSVPGGVV